MILESEESFEVDLLIDPHIAVKAVHCGVTQLHCELCHSRNGIFRSHPVIIHSDEEHPDLIDDKELWAQIYPDEVGVYFL